MRPRRRFGMVLHAKDGQLFVPHPFNRAVVQIDVGDFDLLGQGFQVDCKSMVLRSDRYSLLRRSFTG